MDYSYILTSSKNGHNFDYLIYKLNKIKEKNNLKEKRRIFVIGNTNVGKSTFINQLIHRSDRFHKTNPKFYQSHVSIADNIKLLTEQSLPKSNLTSSILAGTTLGITKVEDIHLGVRVSIELLFIMIFIIDL